MKQANRELRLKAAGAGIKLWMIANKLNYTDSYFSRLLRVEFTGELKERAYKALDELKKEAS